MSFQELNIPQSDIECFYYPLCSKFTSIRHHRRRSLCGQCNIHCDIYLKILSVLCVERWKIQEAGFVGVRWANSGGESTALGTDKVLAVDGIHNVISILEEIENEKLEDVDFLEALACQGGCLGGPLTVENMFVAKVVIKKYIDEAKKKGIDGTQDKNYNYDMVWTGNVEYRPIMKLDKDFEVAMKKLETLHAINKELPGLDCGACGAPSCRALAEDIVRGSANETDCIFKLREKVRSLAMQMMELEEKMPPVLDKEGNVKKKTRKRGDKNEG